MPGAAREASSCLAASRLVGRNPKSWGTVLRALGLGRGLGAAEVMTCDLLLTVLLLWQARFERPGAGQDVDRQNGSNSWLLWRAVRCDCDCAGCCCWTSAAAVAFLRCGLVGVKNRGKDGSYSNHTIL